MRKKLPNLKQLNILIVTLALLFGPFTLYYLFYFSNQKNYYINRDLRLLSVLGRGIEKKVDGAGAAYRTGAKEAARHFYKNVGDKKCEAEGDFEKNDIIRESLSSVLDSQQFQKSSMNQEKQEKQRDTLTLDVQRDDSTRWLYLNYVAEPNRDCLPVGVRAGAKLDDFVQPFFRRFLTGKDFDGVFIAESDGDVLYQITPEELRLTNFEALFGKDQGKIDFERLRQNGNVADLVISESEYKLFIQPIELSLSETNAPNGQPVKWIAGGLVRTSHLNSESRAISYTILIVLTFAFMLVVLSFPFLKLIFMGPRDVLGVADMYFLAFSAVVGSALLTIFLVYANSYYDLERTMDSQLRQLSDRISANFDGEVLTASRQLEAMNSDCRLIAEINKLKEIDKLQKSSRSRRVEQKTEPQIQSHIDSLQKSAVSSGAHLSQKSDRQESPQAPGRCAPEDKLPKYNEAGKVIIGRKNITEQLMLAKGSTLLGIANENGDKIDWPYLPMTNTTWVDQDGWQRIKWTTRPTLPGFQSVSERAYFNNVLAGRSWEYARDTEHHKIVLEPVYSKLTGGQQVILAMSVAQFPGWVATMDFRAASLVDTVLPREMGYGYCVIDSEGNVLFHSDKARNQVENFFRESDNDGDLRSTVLAREAKAMTVPYLGDDHRLYVTPIHYTPWTLVTFRDKQIARAGGLELMAYGIYLFCLYAVILLVIFAVYYTRNREDRSALLWPYKKRALNYYISIFINILLAIGYGLAIGTLNKMALLIVTFLLPPLAFFICHRNLKRSGDFGSIGTKVDKFIEKKTRLNYRHGYVLTLVSLLMLVSVLPTLAFFKFAYDRELKLFIRLGQINLARGLEERFERVHAQYVSSVGKENANQNAQGELITQLLTLDRCDVSSDQDRHYCDVYAQFFFNTSFETSDHDETSLTSDAGAFDSLLERLAFFKNSVSLPVRGLNRSMGIASGTSIFKKEGDSDTLVLHADEQVDGNPAHKTFHATSHMHALGRRCGRLWWLGLSLILLLIPLILFVLITFVGRRIFLLNTDEPLWDYGEKLSDSARSQNLLMLASRFTRKNEMLQASGYEVLDLQTVKITEKWIHAYDEGLAKSPGNPSVAINHFEYKLEDSRLNFLKVRLLELLLARNKTVIVASAVDLAAYDFAGARHASVPANGEPPAALDTRPAAVFNSLRRFHLEDKGNTKKLNEELDKYRQSLNLSKLTRTEVKGIERLLKALKRECQPRAYLQQTGLRLLQRKDFCQMTPDRVGWRVLESCNAYYQALWDTCSKEEKLTLVSLATNVLVSSANPSLPRLLRSGLASREPFLRPMNESFAKFVAAQATPDNLQDWKSSDERSSWDILKFPLLLILLGAAAFLFISQRDLYNSTLTFVSAFAAVMPTLFKFLGFFPGGKG